MKFFNTAGPIKTDLHYHLNPLERIDLSDLLFLIEQEKYFVLHAPRQTGKTSCLLALRDFLNAEGKYRCVYANVEAAQGARENVKGGIKAILSEIASRAKDTLKDEFPRNHFHEIFDREGEHKALNESLTQWTEQSSQPLIVLIDEIDSLIGDTLISVLRQLRSGYDKRPQHFPQTVILCGVRDVRDYRIHSSQSKEIITGGSAFNIKAESLRLGDFSRNEVETLILKHTEETGQIFEPGVLQTIGTFAEGQPWLTNALAYEACFGMKPNRDRSRTITVEMMYQAKENLILRRDTHIDQLGDKLREKRVRRIVEPILTGNKDLEDIPDDDLQYVADLGLIKRDQKLRISNPIYQEVIPRTLTYTTTAMMTQQSEWYVRPEDGSLDMKKLLDSFQEFFREHSEHWEERFHYKEAGPQLLLQAYLQRIVNGGGRIDREYGLGRMRTDLFLIWPLNVETHGRASLRDEKQKVVIELKILYKTLEKTIEQGLQQTHEYLQRCGAEEAYLLIFDRNPSKSWDDKVFSKDLEFQGKSITVYGM